jgi:hypothetical protein
MPYLGQGNTSIVSNFRLLDDLSNDFDGKRTIFEMKSEGNIVFISSIGSTFIHLDNVLLLPEKDYYISSDNNSIVFIDAPKKGSDFSGRVVEQSGLTIPDGSISKEKLSIALQKSETFHFTSYSDDTIRFELFPQNSNLADDSNEVLVFVEGLYQRPERDYIIDGNELVFDNPPPLNSEIDVIINNIVGTKTKIQITEKSICSTETIEEINKCIILLENKLESQTIQTSNYYNILWVFNERMEKCQQCSNNGNCCEIANGKCCQWTVPAGVTKATFEIWSAGGGGAGQTCCNCCSMGIPAAGGSWAVKTIGVTAGDTYTICAGGTYSCEQFHGCSGGKGCTSYVTGNGLTNFCVLGGCGGTMCNGDAHGPRTNMICANQNICPHFGADFGMAGTTGTGNSNTCHCWTHHQIGGTAPWIGTFGTQRSIEYWCVCSCFIPGWGAGGMTGDSTYCGSNCKCCAGGGMGGPGLVKVTYY